MLVSSNAIQNSKIRISDSDTLHHLLRVLRIKMGERIACLDGQGKKHIGHVIECRKSGVVVAIDEQSEESAPVLRLVLFQALIRPQRFDWVIQKATELGATSIIPVITSRTTIRWQAEREKHRLARWRKIAESAAAQSARASVPSLEAPRQFEAAVDSCGGKDLLLLTVAVDAPHLEEHIRGLQDTKELAVMIGPEGDFSPEEVDYAKKHGAHTAQMGQVRLRSETATVAALAILQYAMGELSTIHAARSA